MGLRDLCVELRKQSNEVFSPGLERQKLKQEASMGLEDEATNRYFQELEKQRNAHRADVAAAVELGRQLRNELEGKKRGLAISRTSTPQASARTSHSFSRPRTPATPKSNNGSIRANSRPPALQSRPGTSCMVK